MKKLILPSGFLVLFLIAFSSNGFCQKGDTLKDRDWRIEVEPASFVLRGFNLHVSRNITKDNKLNIGLYMLSLDLPASIEKGLFKNVPENAKVRLGFEAALVTRYIFIPKIHALQPYVGLITGWEYFDISQPLLSDVRISTGIVTPFLGCELYLFQKRVFVNPQLRGVIYVAPTSSQPGRPEALQPFFLLPAISVGVRL